MAQIRFPVSSPYSHLQTVCELNPTISVSELDLCYLYTIIIFINIWI